MIVLFLLFQLNEKSFLQIYSREVKIKEIRFTYVTRTFSGCFCDPLSSPEAVSRGVPERPSKIFILHPLQSSSSAIAHRALSSLSSRETRIYLIVQTPGVRSRRTAGHEQRALYPRFFFSSFFRLPSQPADLFHERHSQLRSLPLTRDIYN